VRLQFWTLALRPWFDEYVTHQIKGFEAAHPGVEVEWVDVPYDALERKLIASAAAGQAPDVVNMSDMNFARFVSLGAFRDIRGDVPGDPDATYLPNALALCRFSNYQGSSDEGGQGSGTQREPSLLGLPWYVNTQTLFANTELLERGLGPMWRTRLSTDWRGLIALAREFKSNTGLFLFSQPLGDESEVPQMLLSEGLAPLRASADGGIEPNLDGAETREFLQAWVDLYREGLMPREAATKGHSHLTEMYQQGQLGLANTGPNFLKRIRDVAPEIYAKTVVLPGMTGKLGRGHIPVMVLAVTTQTMHPKEAAALAWWMTGPESQLEFCTKATILPSTASTLSDPFFAPPTAEQLASPEGKILQARSVTAKSLPDAVAYTCALETWPDLRRAFQDRLKRTLLDGVPLEKTLKDVEADWRKILASAPKADMSGVPTPTAVALPRRDEGVAK
jgi:putative chitobiose transport system substrate-binding protein